MAGALRHTRVRAQGPVLRGRAVDSVGELLVPGDEVRFGPVLRTRVVAADYERSRSVLVRGLAREFTQESVLAEVGHRTLVTASVRWRAPFGVLGRIADVLVLRRWVLAALSRRLAAVRELAEEWARRPVVVGAAIVHDGQLLAQRRSYPAADAGRWELPGGRVDPGESEHEAVVRECREELGATVVPTGRVGTDVPLDGGMLLRVHTARLAEGSAAPRAVEHHEARWVGPGELGELDWLDADQVLVPALRELVAESR